MEIETTLTLRNNIGKKFFLVGNEVILDPEFRKDGVYESSGVGHFMSRRNAFEITSDFAFDSFPGLFFENLKNNGVIFQFLLKRNDEFAPLDTESEYGGKHTRLTRNGWRIFDTVFDCNKNENKIVTAWILNQSSIIDAYLVYRSLPEFKSYYNWIKRPEFLKSVRCDIAADEPDFENAMNFLREGVILRSSPVFGDFSWGDFPVEGEIRSGNHELRTVEEMQKEIDAFHNKYPRLKIGFYTWLWSVTTTGNFYQKHPEMFISTDRSGNPISFFPVGRPNPYRNIGAPGCLDVTALDILKYLKYYHQDIWYLDGGSATLLRDWKKMSVGDPLAWHRLYAKIRNEYQKENSDGILFFNSPYQIIADFGLLENSGDIFTNWRTAAGWFFKLKMFQLNDPNHYPCYIYWWNQADELLPAYLAVLGAFPALFHKAFSPDIIPYLSAQYEARYCNIVDRAISPDWREDFSTPLEHFAVKQGESVFILLRNHDTGKRSLPVTLDKTRLGISDISPLYSLMFEMRRYTDKKWQGRLAESEKAKIYQQHGWIEDSLFSWQQIEINPSLNKTLEMYPKTPYLWLVSKSNSFFYSIDNLVLQLPRTETLEQKIFGKLINEDFILVQTKIDRNVEAITILPDGMDATSVKLDGKFEMKFRHFYLNGQRMIIYPVSSNTKTVEIKLIPSVTALANFPKFSWESNGKMLYLTEKAGCDFTLQIYEGNMIVFAQDYSKGTRVEYEFPHAIRGGEYRIEGINRAGQKLFEQKISVNKGTPKITMKKTWPLPLETLKFPINVKGDGFKIYNGASHASKGGFEINFDTAKPSLSIATQKNPPFYIVMGAAGWELQTKRYLKVKLSGNFSYFNKYGKSPGHSRHPGMDWHAITLFFDFHTSNGYVQRSLGGIGKLDVKYTGKEHPFNLNAKSLFRHYFISNWAFSLQPEEVLYLDLKALGAPDDWDGKLIFGAILDHVLADHRIKLEILESADQLPDNVTAWPCIDLSAQITQQKKFLLPLVTTAPEIDGKNNDQYSALTLSDFSKLGNPNASSSQKTKVSFARNNKMLYVFLECEEKELGINTSQTNEGASLFQVDSLELALECYKQPNKTYHLIISPANRIYCKYETGSMEAALDAPLPQHAVRLHPDKKGWNAEFAIPLSALNIKSDGKFSIGFNVMRNRYALEGTEYLTLVPGGKYIETNRYKMEWEDETEY